MGELSQNTSTSVTNMAEYLVPELIQRHFPQRFEELPPAIFLEHYVEERTPQGRLGRKATWDRLSFHSSTQRRVWLSGQERLSFGDPHWEHLPAHEVEALLGREEMRALPPQVSIANDQAWRVVDKPPFAAAGIRFVGITPTPVGAAVFAGATA
jgi:hypothetical protein